jgi:phenylpropionate dioxygenase-like ring-hydroxylating dioxygenase large terminal subunit
MVNICQHRGVQVVPAGCGVETRRFTCPFHGWIYGIDGHLASIPGAEGFSDIDRRQRRLTELSVEERYGMIFVATSPDTSFDLDDYLCGLGEHFSPFGFETWKPVAPVHEHTVKANWKVVFDTHLDVYHFSNLHGDSVGPILYNNTSIPEFYGDHTLMAITLRNIDGLRHQVENQWQPVKGGHLNLNYRLFPNLSLSVVFGDRLEIYQILPGTTVGDTVALHYAYRNEIPDDEDERKQLEKMVRYACEVVEKEDYRIAESAYIGYSSPNAPKTILIGRNEMAMQHLHHALHRSLSSTEEPA